VAILRGGGWVGHRPLRFFLGPQFGPLSFFLNFPFKFVWLTYAGLPNAFCKNTGHFVNSARSSYVIIHKRYRENRDNQYCWATVNTLSVFWLIRYISVCARRDNRTKDCVNSRKLTSLKKLSWQDSLQQSLWFEKFCVSYFWSYGKLIIYFHNTGFRHWFSKYRPFTGLC